jgi:flagellar hook assembly protein FlgD
MTVSDVPLGARSLAAAASGRPFDLVAVHWQGSGAVLLRSHRIGGRWSAWQAADADSGPDPGSPEARSTAGWRLGGLVWTGLSDGVQVRTLGSVERVRLYRLWSPPRRLVPRALTIAGSPAIIPRAAWSADEAIVRAKPLIAPQLQLAIVHHTVNSNDYTPAQAAAIVRGIEVYHVDGNGWNDIGYNALVDRFGQVYEGRAGGLTKNVVGAHSLGFNVGSFGVALIGNFQTGMVPPAAAAALERLLAWRLDIAHVDPLSTLSFISGGNPRFPAGIPVFLRAISGHRDTYFTECPGEQLYALLPAIAQATAAIGLPKLYAPIVSGKLGGKVRFTATLSSARSWTVTVTDALGTAVGSGSGTGTSVDWTWDSSKVAPGRYTWTIQAGQTTLPASGTIGSAAPAPAPPPIPVPSPSPATGIISGLTTSPAVISPNADGYDDSTKLAYALTAPAAVTATVATSTGQTVATLFSSSQPVGRQSFSWAADGVPDGSYQIVISAVGLDGQTSTATIPLVVDRTLSGLSLSVKQLSPNRNGGTQVETISFALAAPTQVDVAVLRDGQPVASVFSGQLPSGQQQLAWDGSGTAGLLPDGSYQVVVTVSDALGTVTEKATLSIDATPPQLRIVSLKAMRFWLSEPSIVVFFVNGAREVKVEPAGSFHIPFTGTLRTLRAVAWDSAGNKSLAVASRIAA